MTLPAGSRRPDFFLVGAAKCGTTSVAQYVSQHPQVFVSKPKEPNFFAFEPDSKPTCTGPTDTDQLYETLLKYTVTSPAEYAQLFADAKPSDIAGEASVRYLYESHVPARVAECAPDAKLIVLLRDPVDRLYSHYHMNVRLHLEPKSLPDALAAEDERVKQGWGWDWHYRRVGHYADQLTRWHEYFDPSRILVLFHADLKQQPLQIMQAIFQHLGVTTEFEPDFSRRAMVGHTPRSKTLRTIIRDDNVVKALAKKVVPRRIRKSFVSWSESKNRMAIPPLSPDIRQQLQAEFRSANRQLADLLGRELPW